MVRQLLNLAKTQIDRATRADGMRIAVAVVTAVLLFGQPAAAANDRDPQVPSFRNDVMAVLSKSGCNLGTCHGNQHGKGGLKLSLRGQDPELDFLTLTRQLAGRRANILKPDHSLLLQKPTMTVPHEGGRRFAIDSAAHNLLRSWIAAGMPNDSPDGIKLRQLTVTPKTKTLYSPDSSIAVVATAEFSDGSTRDVSSLAVYESSDPAVLISPAGVVSSDRPTQTTVTVRYLAQQAAVRLEFVHASAEFVFTPPPSAGPIDDAVFAQLKRLRINPSPMCDDTTFLRRLYLDVTGLLPTIEQSRTFLNSTEPDKRSRLIDQLLASEEYVDNQTLRWADLLRVEEKTLDAKGVDVYYKWIRAAVTADMPLNQFVSELIAARGSTYSVPQTNFYRALRTPEERAESTAQLFLGIRLQCAKCHNHPFDHWTQQDYYGWSGFFARIDYKIIENKRRDKNDKHEFDGEQIVEIKSEGEVKNPTSGEIASLRFLGDRSAAPRPETTEPNGPPDRLLQLAEWISAPENSRFAATQANRIWYQLMGRGVVDPIDDFRATNPASNPELFELLQREFVAADFRTRPLMRQILNSATYQLSSVANDSNVADEISFSHHIPRRLTAEQTLDAISHVVGAAAAFGGHPAGTRAVQLTGVRNGGFRYSVPEAGDRFLQLFGKPDRLQTCECERSEETTLAQTFELVSGQLVQQLLKQDDGRIATSVSSDQPTENIISDLYWSALSRPPADSELASLITYVNTKPDRRAALDDIVWALVNSNEFLLRR